MKRWQKILLGVAVVAIGLGTVAYLNRITLLLAYVSYRGSIEVAANRPVPWQEGPARAELPPAERPPNIVFILFDDLGINDLSTFGGGVADGRVPTPHIDRLAAEGAIFTQAYAGNATCSPSR
ncbi:MAG: arylsulfatase, partial [Porphyrobacter sp. HL-46]